MVRFGMILGFIFFALMFCAFTPVRISFDVNCHISNSAILGRLLLQTFGEKSVKKWMDARGGLVLGVKVDSLGYVTEVVNVVSEQKISESFKHQLENALMRSKTYFSICHKADLSEEEKERFLREEEDVFLHNGCRIVSYIAFPGELMEKYEADKAYAAKRNLRLPKYNYLLSQLKNY